MNNQRIEYFDILRCLGIVMVVSIHCFKEFDIVEENTLTYHFAIIWRQLIGFAVPLFLTISGFLLSKKNISSKTDYIRFLKKQIPKVYIPMLIWSIPYLILAIYTKENIFKSILFFILGGYSVYYFIILIIQYYIMLPLFQKYNSSTIFLNISAVISIISLIIIFYFTKILHISVPLIFYGGSFSTWIIFFALGVYLSNNKISLSFKSLFLFSSLGLVLSVLETYFQIKITNEFQGLGIKISAFIYSSLIILLLFNLDIRREFNHPLWKVIKYIGKISFGIYLIHIFFLNIIVKPLIQTLNISNYFLEQFLFINLTLISCILFITGVRSIKLPTISKYLGF